MDNKLKKNENNVVDQRRLEMFRKARKAAADDQRAENEERYQNRVDDMKRKKTQKEVVLDDGDDFLNGLETFGDDN